jgi:hypothetical protein
MKIKTDIWSYERELLIDKFYKILWFFGIGFFANIIISVFNQMWFNLVYNGLFMLVIVLISDSYFKYKKEVEKQ